jgi:hypothetical protein
VPDRLGFGRELDTRSIWREDFAAIALADALEISLAQLAGQVTYDLDLSGTWWCAWQTWKDGVPRVDARV